MAAAALEGIRVIELGQLIAGPFAAKMLAEFGADVIKVEAPEGGDPLRAWRMIKDGTSVWWQVQSRNKRSVALDLRKPEAQEIIRTLVKDADVLIENFRPGTLEGWGLGWETLHALNPRLIMLSLSGYGQTGPYRDRPGFGVIGILLALRHRETNGGEGQCIDVALYEAVFNVMESLLPEYSAFGAVREATGSSLPGIAPTNAYPCADGYALVAGNGDGIFKRLMEKIGRQDLAEDPQLAGNAGRVARVEELDAAIGAWTRTRPLAEVLQAMEEAKVPSGKVYTAKDISEDPHYRSRDMILSTTFPDGTPLEVPGVVPKLSLTPGTLRTKAPALGEHTESVLREAGVSATTLAELKAKGII